VRQLQKFRGLPVRYFNYLLLALWSPVGLAHAANYPSICSYFVENHIIPGMVFTVFENGVFQDFFCGDADVASKKPFTTSTLFSLGSITKAFTLTLFSLDLVEGRLKVNDKVETYFPELRAYPVGQITLEELATHRSGLDEELNTFEPSNDGDPYTTYTLTKLLSTLKGTTLRPKGYHYSSLGIALLGQILMKVNQQTYGELIYQRLVVPLGLKGRLYGSWREQLRPRMAHNYSNSLEEIPLWTNLNALDATGAIRADLTAVKRLMEAELFPERLPSPLREAVKLSQQIHFRASRVFYVGNADTLLPGQCVVDQFTGEGCDLPRLYPLTSKQKEFFTGRYRYFEEPRKRGLIKISPHPYRPFLTVQFEDGFPPQRLYYDGRQSLKTDDNIVLKFNPDRSGVFTEIWDKKYSYWFWPY
jgi:CubicO group peptidase (beta-lactamase class C family)